MVLTGEGGVIQPGFIENHQSPENEGRQKNNP
jgi:hypothetical protein